MPTIRMIVDHPGVEVHLINCFSVIRREDEAQSFQRSGFPHAGCY